MARPRAITKKEVARDIARTAMKKAVLYARVSTAEQEKEGFSIPAQQKLMCEYAAQENIEILAEYIDVETAKRSGRTEFGKMLAYLRTHRSVRHILVEKTDRLYRNLKDWVTIDEVDIDIHFVKEGVVLNRDSRSSEKFMHGIKVLMAKNYIDNLSEEARKGMEEKARQGLWPSLAPIGYLNVRGATGKKIIVPDPNTSPVITQLFDWCASGMFTVRDLTDRARQAGLRYRRSGNLVGHSTVHYILRNRLYAGSFDWNGRIYKGSHEPIVSGETWEDVQAILDARSLTNLRSGPLREFAYAGLMTCGHCGCAIVSEIKKEKYVYYHCSGFKRRCPGKYVREEVLTERFQAVLGRVQLDDEIFALMQRALRESHADEKCEREEVMARLRSETDRIQSRLDIMYLDKIDGRISAEFHDRIAAQWRAERARHLSDIDGLHTAEDDFVDDGIALLNIAQTAHIGFPDQSVRHRRRALKLLLSNCTWTDGELSATFRQPFDMLAGIALLAPAGDDSEMTDRADLINLVTPTRIELVLTP